MIAQATVSIANVWERAADGGRRVLLAEAPDDILIALNCLPPGGKVESHYHLDTGQSFLVLKGSVVIRNRYMEQPVEETTEVTLSEGDSILIPAHVYYSLDNPGPGDLVLYQVKQPEKKIVVDGKGEFDVHQYFARQRQNQ